MFLTIDSSVWIAAFMDEEKTSASERLIREVIAGQHHLVTPIVIPLEVISALQRRSNESRRLAEEVYNLIISLPNNEFVELDFTVSDQIKEIVKETSLKANDAFILFACQQFESQLVTLDQELNVQAMGKVEILKL